MILVIDVCESNGSLSYDEFLRPVVESIPPGMERSVRHYTELVDGDISKAERIIICGTALADNGFMEHKERFSWLKTTNKPVLGICAGMQLIATAFGAKLANATEMGMTEITVRSKGSLLGDSGFKAYELHNFAPELPAGFVELANSASCIQAFVHKTKPLMGVLFHPEVRNRRIIAGFCGA